MNNKMFNNFNLNLNIVYLLNLCFLILFLCNTVSSENQNFDKVFDHNQEHLKEEIKDHYHMEFNEKLSDKEIDFYNFKMHDFDNNLLLDGLEILTAINHVIDENSLTTSTTTSKPNVSSGRMHPSNDNEDELPDPQELINMRDRFRRQVHWNEKFARDSEIIDGLLKEYDKDRDGFISFAEYSVAKKY